MSCRRDTEGYWLRAHRDDCRDRRCAGCVPCSHDDNGNPVRHCQVRRTCTSHLGPGEECCPKCLGLIKSDLAEILNGAARASDVAVDDGIDSAAMVLAGPSANPILNGWYSVNAAKQGYEVDDPDKNDPYRVLAGREQMIREELGHDETILCSDTLSATVQYLRWVLPDLATEERLWMLLDLADRARQLRAHIDGIEHNSRTPDRGVECPACPSSKEKPAPRLIRKWAHHCTKPDCTREHDTTGARDTWQCPRNPEHWWSEADYRLWVADDYLANAESLTASQMETQHGVKSGTLRKWVERGEVHRRGRDHAGRQLYDVSDTLAMRDGVRATG